MSRKAGELYHPANFHAVKIWDGFSWPCLFFAFLWYLYKGMLLKAMLAFLVAVATFGVGWFIFPFIANRQHRDFLLKQGYLSAQQAQVRAGVNVVVQRQEA